MIAEMTYLWTIYFSTIFAYVLILSTLGHMAHQRRDTPSIVAWLLAIILLPYIAVPFYFILRSRKLKRNRKTPIKLKCTDEVDITNTTHVDMILRSNGIAGATRGNKFKLYTDGVDAYHSLIAEIHRAEKRILISTYVFKSDEVGKSILAELTKKALQGVDVRLLVDSVGSMPLYIFQGSLRQFKKSGGKVAFYMPLLKRPFQNYINLRNHRKIFLFDDTKVIAGGMNLSHEYMGPVPCDDRWQDILFSIDGPAVFHYREIFTEDWNFTSQHQLEPYQLISLPKGDTRIQVVPSGPDIETDALYEALLSASFSAKKRIWIVTPYFVPDKGLMQALIIAFHRGVDIKLITPAKSNHMIADLARSSYMRDLDSYGIELCLLPTGMIHAKAILFDDKAVMMGSANIDQRSLFLNYEVVSFIYSKESILNSEEWMKKLIKKCDHKMKPANKWRKIGENLMSVFAPLL
ncbi:phospholipase D-like domain-containing protein [Desulfobacula sp.]|uniref:phospholipase D-like domain-containing protein n=1 Tax=Desulfobacula sp. TaxID=2593537 RepID=UPI0039B93A32